MKDLVVTTNYTHLQDLRVFDGNQCIASIKSTFNDIEKNIGKLINDIEGIDTVTFVGAEEINRKYAKVIDENFAIKKNKIKVRYM